MLGLTGACSSAAFWLKGLSQFELKGSIGSQQRRAAMNKVGSAIAHHVAVPIDAADKKPLSI